MIATHPAVAECAVIAYDDDLKGQVPMGLVVLKSGVSIAEVDLQQQLISRIRDTIGAIDMLQGHGDPGQTAQDPLR